MWAGQIVLTLYWVALASWFGGALFGAIAAEVVFRVVRHADPTLPKILSVNIDGDHAALLSTEVITEIARVFGRIGAVAALVCLASLAYEAFAGPGASGGWIRLGVRGVLVIVAGFATVYLWRLVLPKLDSHRASYIEFADDPEKAGIHRDAFNRLMRELLNVIVMILVLLLGLIIFSAGAGAVQISFG